MWLGHKTDRQLLATIGAAVNGENNCQLLRAVLLHVRQAQEDVREK